MRYFAHAGSRDFEFRFEPRDGKVIAYAGDRAFELDLSPTGDGIAFSLLIDGASHDLLVEPCDGGMLVQTRGERVRVRVQDERERAAHAVAGSKPTGRRRVTAVMSGVVVAVPVAVGDEVEDGQTVVVIEAMKMQNPIAADGKGRVRAIHVQKGQAVANGSLLVELES